MFDKSQTITRSHGSRVEFDEFLLFGCKQLIEQDYAFAGFATNQLQLAISCITDQYHSIVDSFDAIQLVFSFTGKIKQIDRLQHVASAVFDNTQFLAVIQDYPIIVTVHTISTSPVKVYAGSANDLSFFKQNLKQLAVDMRFAVGIIDRNQQQPFGCRTNIDIAQIQTGVQRG
ncbi:poly-gamma-glutamate hydrolase family protein [Paenibacillus shenyangensis]|uniref:poly-gamma-glutamate hydrolase family protein n=1 Tax=Paenibacillus sp. A9 TaxID=1284352 RepID=UPI003FCCB6EA